MVDLIELLFFAYRDFISDPDAILAKSDFGRAHHRVLHFVDRNPGLTVADLLDILKITKQSLARVLKELVDSGFIEQRTGLEDRRQRLLYRDAGRAGALGRPVGAAGAAHQGGARAAWARRARDGDGLPLRHDQRAGAREGREPGRQGERAMSQAAAARHSIAAGRRAASPRRRRRHAHQDAAARAFSAPTASASPPPPRRRRRGGRSPASPSTSSSST